MYLKIFIFLYLWSLFNCTPIGFYQEEQTKSYSIINSSEDCDVNVKNCKNFVTKEFELASKSESAPEQKLFDTPPIVSQSFTEHFILSNKNDIEILVVVDTSSSMDKNLEKLGKNLSYIISSISTKNWRLAFTTADHGDHDTEKSGVADKWTDYSGDLPRFGQLMNLEKSGKVLNQVVLNKNTPGYIKIFKDTLTRTDNNCDLPPYCQGDQEQPLRALQSSFYRNQQSKFFQADTDTIVLIITDEDERIGDHENATTAEEVIKTYNQVFRGQNKRLFGFSISIQDEECYNKEKKASQSFWKWFYSGTAEYGHMVGQLAELTGGKNISLCSNDYSNSLLQISQFTKYLIESSIVLEKYFYLPKTVKIDLFPSQPNISWKFYGRKVIFSNGIKTNTKIKVSYQYQSEK